MCKLQKGAPDDENDMHPSPVWGLPSVYLPAFSGIAGSSAGFFTLLWDFPDIFYLPVGFSVFLMCS